MIPELDPTDAASADIRAWFRGRVQHYLSYTPDVSKPLRVALPKARVVVAKPQPKVAMVRKPRKSRKALEPKPRKSCLDAIPVEQIIERLNAGETLTGMSQSLGLSKGALSRRIHVHLGAGMIQKTCLHCGTLTGRTAKAKYCKPCEKIKASLASSSVNNGPRALAAREALKVFDQRKVAE